MKWQEKNKKPAERRDEKQQYADNMTFVYNNFAKDFVYKSNGVNKTHPFSLAIFILDIESIPFRLEFCIHERLKNVCGATATLSMALALALTKTHWKYCNTNKWNKNQTQKVYSKHITTQKEKDIYQVLK